jgi:hypothetical protein
MSCSVIAGTVSAINLPSALCPLAVFGPGDEAVIAIEAIQLVLRWSRSLPSNGFTQVFRHQCNLAGWLDASTRST